MGWQSKKRKIKASKSGEVRRTFAYGVIKDETQRRYWAFYKAIKGNS